MTTVVSGPFEWDDETAARNLVINKVSFAQAVEVMTDRDSVRSACPGTNRFIVVGPSRSGRKLFVVWIERGPRDRILSARPASVIEQLEFLKNFWLSKRTS
jgi:uncharacterized DUF497 family protein